MNETRRRWLSLLFALGGLTAIVWLAADIGTDRLLAAARELAGYWPVVLGLEGARIATDAAVVRTLYGERGSHLDWRGLAHASLVAYPVNLLLPAGRLGAEALRAALLRREVGLPRVASAAVLQQALPLLCQSIIAIPVAVVALVVWGPTWLSGLVALQAVTAIALSTTLLFAMRRPAVGALVERLSVRLGAATTEVQADLRVIGLPRRALLLSALSRLCLGAQVVVLALAVGVPRGFVGGLLTLGVHLVGLALGDLIPAQLGATDGALAFGAEPLGAPAASLVVVSLMFHASQLVWAAIGAAAALRLPQHRASAGGDE